MPRAPQARPRRPTGAHVQVVQLGERRHRGHRHQAPDQRPIGGDQQRRQDDREPQSEQGRDPPPPAHRQGREEGPGGRQDDQDRQQGIEHDHDPAPLDAAG